MSFIGTTQVRDVWEKVSQDKVSHRSICLGVGDKRNSVSMKILMDLRGGERFDG